MSRFIDKKDLERMPDYTFDHEPSIAEMREMTVRAMRDMLSVPWHTPSGYIYRKTGAVAYKTFEFDKDVCYLGLPYTNAQRTLFGFLLYQDPETGAILEDDILEDYEKEQGEKAELGASVNRVIGNTYTGSTGWAMCAVSSSVRGQMVSYTLTMKNGFYPVGDYTYDPEIEYFHTDHTTDAVLAATGREKMYECYALAQAGDLITHNDENPATGHSMMLIEPACVVRREDGSIDDEKSSVNLQDQASGFFEFTNEDGVKGLSSGHLSTKLTFATMFERGYMPVSTAEMLGRKPYEFPKIEVENAPQTAADLEKTVLKSNYALAVVLLTVRDRSGKIVWQARKCFDRNDISAGRTFEYSLEPLWQRLKAEGIPKSAKCVTVEAVQCCGKVYDVLKTEL